MLDRDIRHPHRADSVARRFEEILVARTYAHQRHIALQRQYGVARGEERYSRGENSIDFGGRGERHRRGSRLVDWVESDVECHFCDEHAQAMSINQALRHLARQDGALNEVDCIARIFGHHKDVVSGDESA